MCHTWRTCVDVRMMNLFRKHWYDVGGVLGLLLLILVLRPQAGLSSYQLLMWLSLASLFFHQVEEYRFPGTFPGMINRKMFHSDRPDRYPLNTNTAMLINVGMGWTLYLLAALAGDRLIWLGMSAMLVSLGNIVAHTFLFNLKGRTLYNAGLATCWLFFAPCVFIFFHIIHTDQLATMADYWAGIPLGILINVFGVFKPIGWLADRDTTFIFRDGQLLPTDRRNPPR